MTVHRPELARLAAILQSDYEAAPRGDKMTALHLFGIVHAEELAALRGSELAVVAEAAGSPSFATELRKMVKLARFVTLIGGARADEPLSQAFLQAARPLPADYKFDREDANAR